MGLNQKLSTEQVTEIKHLIWERKHTQLQIASKFNVTQTTISRIVSGEQWYSVRWPDNSVGALSLEQWSKSHMEGASIFDISEPLTTFQNTQPTPQEKEEGISNTLSKLSELAEERMEREVLESLKDKGSGKDVDVVPLTIVEEEEEKKT